MKWTKWICATLFVLFTLQGVALAAEGAKPYQIFNRLRVEYDDNIYQTEEDPEGSIKVIEEMEFHLNFSLQQTFISLRYRPAYVWWDKREDDSTDFQHEFDLVVNHTFSPRLNLSLVDTFRRGEQPELVENNVVIRENDDFTYNTLNGTMGYMFRPTTRAEVAGRWITLKYDQSEVGDLEDFDIYVAGLTLREQIVPETTILGELRAETVEYEVEDRGSDSYYVGAGVEQIFSPSLLGSIRGGLQNKEFADSEIGSESSPYADLALTFLPSPATRVTAGAGYSLFETDVYPYANQQRTQVYVSLAHDFTARFSFYMSGGYTTGDYSADQSIEEGAVNDGTEEIILVSARATYKVNRSNWLEAGWQHQDFQSDLTYSDDSQIREEYDRNRFDLGWKTQF